EKGALCLRRLGGTRAREVRAHLHALPGRQRLRGRDLDDPRLLPGRGEDARPRPDNPDLDDGHHHRGAGGRPHRRRRGRRRPRRLARRHGRLVPREHQLPVHGRRPVGGPPRQHHRLRGKRRRQRRPHNRGPAGLQDALRAVLHARGPVQRGPGDHDLLRRARPLDRGGRDPGRLETPVGQRPRLLLLPRPRGKGLRRAGGQDAGRARDAVGEQV
ncbi:MAG: Mll2313 protein, partial [uncultured Rubrobacteraceae bacterium]